MSCIVYCAPNTPSIWSKLSNHYFGQPFYINDIEYNSVTEFIVRKLSQKYLGGEILNDPSGYQRALKDTIKNCLLELKDKVMKAEIPLDNLKDCMGESQMLDASDLDNWLQDIDQDIKKVFVQYHNDYFKKMSQITTEMEILQNDSQLDDRFTKFNQINNAYWYVFKKMKLGKVDILDNTQNFMEIYASMNTTDMITHPRIPEYGDLESAHVQYFMKNPKTEVVKYVLMSNKDFFVQYTENMIKLVKLAVNDNKWKELKNQKALEYVTKTSSANQDWEAFKLKLDEKIQNLDSESVIQTGFLGNQELIFEKKIKLENEVLKSNVKAFIEVLQKHFVSQKHTLSEMLRDSLDLEIIQLNKAANTSKFRIDEVRTILKKTGKKQLIFADHDDNILGIGRRDAGKNLQGKFLETLRYDILNGVLLSDNSETTQYTVEDLYKNNQYLKTYTFCCIDTLQNLTNWMNNTPDYDPKKRYKLNCRSFLTRKLLDLFFMPQYEMKGYLTLFSNMPEDWETKFIDEDEMTRKVNAAQLWNYACVLHVLFHDDLMKCKQPDDSNLDDNKKRVYEAVKSNMVEKYYGRKTTFGEEKIESLLKYLTPAQIAFLAQIK